MAGAVIRPSEGATTLYDFVKPSFVEHTLCSSYK